MGSPRNIGRGPDMVQPPPPVRRVPVRRAISPTGIQQPLRNTLARDIHPIARLLQLRQMIHLDRGVAGGLQQFPVVPDIILGQGRKRPRVSRQGS
jgi:hypothetical protein